MNTNKLKCMHTRCNTQTHRMNYNSPSHGNFVLVTQTLRYTQRTYYDTQTRTTYIFILQFIRCLSRIVCEWYSACSFCLLICFMQMRDVYAFVVIVLLWPITYWHETVLHIFLLDINAHIHSRHSTHTCTQPSSTKSVSHIYIYLYIYINTHANDYYCIFNINNCEIAKNMLDVEEKMAAVITH